MEGLTSAFPGISCNSWPKLSLKVAIFKPFKSKQPYAFGVCSCPKSFPNCFGRGHSSGFPGISRNNWPKLGQKGAIFEIFKPFKSNQPYAFGVCPCPKSFLIFLKWSFNQFSRKKSHNSMTQIGQNRTCFTGPLLSRYKKIWFLFPEISLWKSLLQNGFSASSVFSVKNDHSEMTYTYFTKKWKHINIAYLDFIYTVVSAIK